jgi:hypothetical protein
VLEAMEGCSVEGVPILARDEIDPCADPGDDIHQPAELDVLSDPDYLASM